MSIIPGPVAHLLGGNVIAQHGVVCAAAVIQHSTPVVREGSACHMTRATGRLGISMIGLTQ